MRTSNSCRLSFIFGLLFFLQGCELDPFKIIGKGADQGCFKGNARLLSKEARCQEYLTKLAQVQDSGGSCLAGKTMIQLSEIRGVAKLHGCLLGQ